MSNIAPPGPVWSPTSDARTCEGSRSRSGPTVRPIASAVDTATERSSREKPPDHESHPSGNAGGSSSSALGGVGALSTSSIWPRARRAAASPTDDSSSSASRGKAPLRTRSASSPASSLTSSPVGSTIATGGYATSARAPTGSRGHSQPFGGVPALHRHLLDTPVDGMGREERGSDPPEGGGYSAVPSRDGSVALRARLGLDRIEPPALRCFSAAALRLAPASADLYASRRGSGSTRCGSGS